MLKGKYVAVNAYVKYENDLIINNLIFYLKTLEEEEQIKSKASRRKEMINNRVEIDEIKNRNIIEKFTKLKVVFMIKN